jgi:hypothetical protein
MPPTKVNERHIKHGYLDRLLSVTPNLKTNKAVF